MWFYCLSKIAWFFYIDKKYISCSVLSKKGDLHDANVSVIGILVCLAVHYYIISNSALAKSPEIKIWKTIARSCVNATIAWLVIDDLNVASQPLRATRILEVSESFWMWSIPHHVPPMSEMLVSKSLIMCGSVLVWLYIQINYPPWIGKEWSPDDVSVSSEGQRCS